MSRYRQYTARWHGNANDLIAKGYCRTSNKHRIVVRIDHPDWLAITAKRLGRSKKKLMEEGIGSAADWYRRCISEDAIISVPAAIFKRIPGSGHNSMGYKEADNGRNG